MECGSNELVAESKRAIAPAAANVCRAVQRGSSTLGLCLRSPSNCLSSPEPSWLQAATAHSRCHRAR